MNDANTRWDRRQFLNAGALGLIALAPRAGANERRETQGKRALAEAFDAEVSGFMAARKVPGGALAVVKDRRLVYAKGYGWADREKKIAVEPDSLFRIASVSKPITSLAILKLVEERALTLETRAFELLKLVGDASATSKRDPRLASITIRQLLQHTGGWDRGQSPDPMFQSALIARELGEPPPASASSVIQYMLRRPLDFDPGTREAYSNFGYCVLGRVIEQVASMSYEKYVRETILAPLGIQRMRIGASLDGRQSQREVRYYMPNDERGPNVFSKAGELVPWPYGGFCLETMDAHGGWIASAVDLARFAAALDDPDRCKLLTPRTLEQLYAPPPAPVARQTDGSLGATWYGCGWCVRPIGTTGRANYWHNGSLPGTSTLLVRRWDGLSWVVLFNQRSEDRSLPDGDIDPALHRAADSVSSWPAADLFDRF